MPHCRQKQDHSPEHPSGPQRHAHDQQQHGHDKRHPAVPLRRNGVQDMAAIQLSCGNQVERGDKSPTQLAIRIGWGSRLSMGGTRGTQAASSRSNGDRQWLVKLNQRRRRALPAGRESRMPTIVVGSATRYPAIGPAMPTSISARREGMRERMRITAPAVPLRVGAGNT